MSWGDGESKGGMVAFIECWLSSGLPNVTTSYEEMSADTEKELGCILDALGVEPVHPLAEAVKRQSFEARREWAKTYGHLMNYGRDYQLRFLRRGIVGSWRDTMTPDELALVERHFGELITRLGYRDVEIMKSEETKNHVWDRRWRGSYDCWERKVSAGKYSAKLDDGAWQFTAGVLSAGPLPIHPTSHLLVETVAQLQPQSVVDIGCGAGDDLHNVGLLLPGAKLYGCDVSSRAIELALERSSVLAGRATLAVLDAADENAGLPRAELVYTHTVLMHLFDHQYLTALRNALWAAAMHVVLSENWGCHPFMADIKQLYADGALSGWNEPYIYYRTLSMAGARFGLMIVSKDGGLPYEPLNDYDALSKVRARQV